MKKNYFFAMLMAFAMVSINAQFVDDMESYTDGQPISQDHWSDWGCGGGAGCAIMSSSAQAQGGSLSGYVPGDGTTDALLLLGDKIFGEWGLKFYMYIPSGKEGYWNIQGTPVGTDWIVGNIFFNYSNANPGFGWCGYDPVAPEDVQFNFPHDEWFDVVINIDITSGMAASTWQMYVDGVEATNGFQSFDYNGNGEYADALGSIDFYSISTDNEYWVDTFEYADHFLAPDLGLEDLEAKGFSAYPNPVNDVLNLKADEAMTSVVIHNLLGQEVYRANLSSLNTTVDMSNFSNGAYFVTVSIGSTEGTIKVMK